MIDLQKELRFKPFLLISLDIYIKKQYDIVYKNVEICRKFERWEKNDVYKKLLTKNRFKKESTF